MHLEAGSVSPGQSVLEVGAGTGDQTLAIAERVGPGGRVLATDVSAEMLAVAEERVEAAGFDNVEFLDVPAAALDRVGSGFDAAISGFTLMLTPDPVASVSTIARLLRPGAPLVASVWGPPQRVPLFSAAVGAVFEALGKVPPRPEGPGLFALAQPDRLREVFETAGLTDVAVTPFPVRMTFASAQVYAEFTRDIAVVISDLVERLAPDHVENIWDAVARSVEDGALDDGSIVFDNEALLATGRRPG